LADYKSASDEFDRGHMSPSGDMPDKKSQRESFSLANMVPQNACNNEEIWEGIESAVRQLAQEEDEVFIVTGPVYEANVDQVRRIGDNEVAVPTELFKAIYVPSRDEGAAYVVINQDTKEGRVLSLDGLRQLIGIDVFPSLSERTKTVAMRVPRPHRPRFKCRLH
jgi:endonuclease G, mitochondrial